jgi:hypothetical protein
MNTMMIDRPCRHCGFRMRWDAEDQCFKCFSHHWPSGYHSEFEAGSQNICHCPACFAERSKKPKE